MSVEPGQSSGGPSGGSSGEGRRFSALIGSLAASRGRGNSDDQGDQEAPSGRPTFTAHASGPATAGAPGPADAPDAGAPARNSAPAPGTAPAPGAPAAPPTSPTPPGGEGTRTLPRPTAAAMDEPLLGDADRLRARWQQVQASFVDDPPQAVGDAADLIEQTAQALVGALRQRQRQLRVMWERGPDPAPGDGEPAAPGSDTEHLRLMMQRYRALFNQLCRS